MNPIFSALNSGYDPDEILGFLSKAIPQMMPMVKKAKSSGYPAKQILGFLSKSFETESREGLSESARHAVNRRADAERTKFGLKALGTAVAAPLAGKVLQNALSRALPSSLGIGEAGSGNLISQGAPPAYAQSMQSLEQQQGMPQATQALKNASQQPPIPQAIPAVTPQSIPQPSVPLQAIKPQRDIKKSLDIIKNLGEEGRIKNLLDGGLAPKDIAGVLSKLMPKDKLRALEGLEGGVEGAIEDYVQAIQGQQQELSTMESVGQELDESAKEIKAKEEIIEAPKPVTKNSIVSSPSGIGEVREIRNGKALVEVDGKLHKVDEADLEPPSFTEDEIADSYDDLMSKIPEEHKSGFISWAGYDDERNVIGFIPRGGKYEELHNITPEEAEKIKEGKGVARTTGETREGLWVMGEDTRGGVISQIIHDRRKKHKGEEEKQLKLGFELPKPEKEDKGMKPIFDEMAHARALSRERERKKILAERERKKKERDEAKKRKK